MANQSLEDMRDFYREFLMDNVVPYWDNNGLDFDNGGFLNCMKDDGTRITDDKLVMYQGRGLFTFSYLYNHFDKSEERLDFITKTRNLLLAYGRDDKGDWIHKLGPTGEVREGPKSIYTDMAVCYGLTEYYRATGDKESLEAARETAMRVANRMDRTDFVAEDPMALKSGYRNQGLQLLFINALTPLCTEVEDSELEEVIERCLRLILDHHLDRDRKIIIEILDKDFKVVDFPEGRDYLPGDGIEAGWIFMAEALRRKDEELKETALTILDWHLDAGWDKEYDGIFWWLNIDRKTPHNEKWDNKMWWCHTESLIATSMAFENTGNEHWLDWFRKVHDYAFRVFPDKENGEWRSKCDRKGNPIAATPPVPVKDNFRVLRSMMFVLGCLERLVG